MSHDMTGKSYEATSVGETDFMKAVVAGCSIIAFADGSLDDSERTRILALFRTNPALMIFSKSIAEAELDRYKNAFEESPVDARRRAYVTISSLRLSKSQAQLILDACQQVLEADGVAQPVELTELEGIRTVLQTSLSEQ